MHQKIKNMQLNMPKKNKCTKMFSSKNYIFSLNRYLILIILYYLSIRFNLILYHFIVN